MKVTVLQTTDVLTVDEIHRGEAQKLRERILRDCGNRGTTSYVLLVGDFATKDPAPEKTVLPPLKGTAGRMKAELTDNGFGCLGRDLLPTVSVGRLPVKTVAQAREVIQKILKFEQDGQKGSWRRRITLLVGDPGGGNAFERRLGNCGANISFLVPPLDL